ncbi:hypothetical protein [Paraburkholderia sp. SIMBA_054]|uniref:hypothetical protein n=1 Tax=Paraburkholderia sp. SIMBA_054 TaxID=3085795 RepID=UPI003978A4D3
MVKQLAHEKDMGSYSLFVWRDAMELTSLLEEDFTASEVLESFEKLSDEQRRAFELEHEDTIIQILGKTVSQRRTFLKAMLKSHSNDCCGLLLVFAAIAQVRTMEIIELRDRYRAVLAPGQGNRDTAAGLYGFYRNMTKLPTYEWPFEVFDAYGGYSGLDSAEEDDDSA